MNDFDKCLNTAILFSQQLIKFHLYLADYYKKQNKKTVRGLCIEQFEEGGMYNV